MIGCLRTRVRKQPINALYFESETVFKFYNLEARSYSVEKDDFDTYSEYARIQNTYTNSQCIVTKKRLISLLINFGDITSVTVLRIFKQRVTLGTLWFQICSGLPTPLTLRDQVRNQFFPSKPGSDLTLVGYKNTRNNVTSIYIFHESNLFLLFFGVGGEGGSFFNNYSMSNK